MMKKITKKVLKARERRRNKREFNEKLKRWKESVIIRDNNICQKCHKKLNERKECNPHHMISLQNIKRKYPELLEDTRNGILLCAFCHKWAADSPHQGGLEFSIWLELNKPEQYDYLYNKIYNKTHTSLTGI